MISTSPSFFSSSNSPSHTFDLSQVLRRAQETFAIEAAAIQGLHERTGDNFVCAVERILQTQGRVVVTGMGKSGHVGRKIAATLSSTGTPALFMHPAEASHGDLGMITTKDVVLAISNSGESQELNLILPSVKRLGAFLIVMTGGLQSSLAKHADLVLDSGVSQEACPLNLAPTASTTAQMALGDALAVALLEARGFGAEDFARSHPGGALGRKLLTHVFDVMRTDTQLPCVTQQTRFSDLMREMSAKNLGLAVIVNDKKHALGVFSDGDLRRLIEGDYHQNDSKESSNDKEKADLRSLLAHQVMKTQPRCIKPDALAVDAAKLMELHAITSILVTESGLSDSPLLGIIHIGDLMRVKVI